MWFHVDTIIRYSANCLFEYAQFARPFRDGGTTARPHHVHHPASWSPKQKSSAPLPNLSKDQAGRVAWQVLTRGTPLNHSCGRVAKLALEKRRRVQQRCPRGFSSAALGHRPQNRAKGADPRTGNLKGEKCFCPGVLSPPCPGPPVPGLSWFRVSGSPALPLRVPLCFGSATCFFLLAAGVAFQLPAGGTSGQAQGHRPKNRHRAPAQVMEHPTFIFHGLTR